MQRRPIEVSRENRVEARTPGTSRVKAVDVSRERGEDVGCRELGQPLVENVGMVIVVLRECENRDSEAADPR